MMAESLTSAPLATAPETTPSEPAAEAPPPEPAAEVPQLSRWPKLGSRELVDYAYKHLPYAVLVNKTGNAWLVNRLYQPLAFRPTAWDARIPASNRQWWRYPGIDPDYVLTTIFLWTDDLPPWDSPEALTSAEYQAHIFLGRGVYTRPRGTRKRHKQWLRSLKAQKSRL